MENFEQKKVERHSVKSGGLDKNIEKINNQVNRLVSIIKQIDHLKMVPLNYANLGEKVNERELPALDQIFDYREEYEDLNKETEEAIFKAEVALQKQLDFFRNHTGIFNEEEALKFDKDTGRQEKDK